MSKSPRLRVGDLYCHFSPSREQVWIRALDAHGQPLWQEIYLGYKREDGRRLVLTDSWRLPSWISENTYKTKHKKRRKSFC